MYTTYHVQLVGMFYLIWWFISYCHQRNSMDQSPQ